MGDTQILQEMAAEWGPAQGISVSKWFAKPCLKIGGKVFAGLWGEDVVFKLTGEPQAVPLNIEGARLLRAVSRHEEEHSRQVKRFRMQVAC